MIRKSVRLRGRRRAAWFRRAGEPARKGGRKIFRVRCKECSGKGAKRHARCVIFFKISLCLSFGPRETTGLGAFRLNLLRGICPVKYAGGFEGSLKKHTTARMIKNLIVIPLRHEPVGGPTAICGVADQLSASLASSVEPKLGQAERAGVLTAVGHEAHSHEAKDHHCPS